MSEDEETVCRLTYKEGKEIKDEAMKPYNKMALELFTMGAITFLLFLGAMLVFQTFDIGDHDTLDELLANGDISQGWYDYELKNLYSKMPIFGATLMLAFMIGSLVMSSISIIEGNKALKKANEEKREEEA